MKLRKYFVIFVFYLFIFCFYFVFFNGGDSKNMIRLAEVCTVKKNKTNKKRFSKDVKKTNIIALCFTRKYFFFSIFTYIFYV